MRESKAKVTPKNVKEYMVTVSIRAYGDEMGAYDHPDKGYEEHALMMIVGLREVAVFGLESTLVRTGKQLMTSLQGSGWPVKREDEVIYGRGAFGLITKQKVRGMGRTHPELYKAKRK